MYKYFIPTDEARIALTNLQRFPTDDIEKFVVDNATKAGIDINLFKEKYTAIFFKTDMWGMWSARLQYLTIAENTARYLIKCAFEKEQS